MIINKLTIKNFRSYYGEKTFRFGNKLNLILGSNGDGKSTFFEALNWVLTPTEAAKKNNEEDLQAESLVSAKLLKNLSEEESASVTVSIDITYETGKLTNSRIIERGFIVTKIKGKASISERYHKAFVSAAGKKGKELMSVREVFEADGAFPAIIKKYHLFKGEDKLNIFDNKETLQNLIDLYSDVKDMMPFVSFANYAEGLANKAIAGSKQKASSQATTIERLNKEIAELNKKLEQNEAKLRNVKQDYAEADEKLEGLKEDMPAIKKINELQDKLKDIRKYKALLQRKIDEEYSRRLLDSQWILMGFGSVLDEYNRKMRSFLASKENIERDYAKKQEEEHDKKKTQAAKTELEKIAWKMNDVEKMKYMLHTHRCAICGTEAVEGSITYDFIKQRIHDVIELLTPKPSDEKVEIEKFYSYDNIEELTRMGEKLADADSRSHVPIDDIPTRIKRIFDQNLQIRNDIADLDGKYEKIEKKIASLNANSVSGINLMEYANDIETVNQWYDQRSTSDAERTRLLQVTLPKIKEDLQKKREELKKCMKGSGGDAMFEVYDFFRALSMVINETEENVADDLLAKISQNANVYLSRLNVDDFTGVIRIYKKLDVLTIELEDKNGKVITNPNTSLLTTMHISILLAISELTKESQKVEYPLIFDAPTSSFDEGKDKSFYNCLNEKVDKQCIVVTKSYLLKDEATGEYVIDKKALSKLNCKKFRIRKLSDGFDKLDITTIDTQVKEL